MKSFMPNVYRLCLLAYLAILPMADTIALRNLLLLLLLLILLAWGMGVGRSTLRDTPLRRWIPLPLVLWCVYLLLFPIWAAEPDVAWVNLKGQWGISILAWIVGLGAVLMLGRRGPSVGSLALASAFLVGLHLLLTLVAWSGLFGHLTESALSWPDLWQALRTTLTTPTQTGWHVQPFPWGFRGFDPMHGNLGYTASQTIVLLVASLVMALQSNRFRWAWGAILGVVLSLFSIVVASSRGAVLFSLVVLFLGMGAYLLHGRVAGAAIPTLRSGAKPYVRWIFPLLGLLMIVVVVLSLQKDSRWRPMMDGIRVGFMITDPIGFQCDGLSSGEEALIRQRFADRPPAYADELISLLIGDSGRIVLMRVGIQMVAEHPWGLDGSRQSYKKLMAARCGHTPAFAFAHAHQGWVDTALALGWVGALLWALLLCSLLLTGWRAMRSGTGGAWAWALFLLSAFWILRGFADSVYREHNLQMQAVLLGYLWGRLQLEMRMLFPTDAAT